MQLAAGLCCGISCLVAGGAIGLIGETGVMSFGLKASGGRPFWNTAASGDGDRDVLVQEGKDLEDANRLYVGLLIMLIFSEALALYGLIVALILSQHTFYCGK